MLIASSAAPGLIGRFFYGTLKQLKVTEQIIGARPVGSVFIGPMFQQERPALPGKAQNRVRAIVTKLI